MRAKNQPELYQAFVQFIRKDIQHERRMVNRRMFHVFIWCFLLPALTSVMLLLLVKLNVLPARTRGYPDWLMLIFPVLYSIYILGSEVLAQFPTAMREGGVATTLGQSLKEGIWRDKTTESMKAALSDAGPEDWRWIESSFRMDLEILHDRTKYLTVLAGAVFFLLLQGIDLLSGDHEVTKFAMVKDPELGWVETPNNEIWQFASMAIFLALLYLSGNQTYRSLRRYLNCIQLMILGQSHGAEASVPGRNS